MDLQEVICIKYCEDNVNFVCQMPDLTLFMFWIMFFATLLLFSRKLNAIMDKKGYPVDFELISGMAIFGLSFTMFMFQVIGIW